MRWAPIQMPEHPLSPQVRSLISRLTLIVVTIALAYASYRCIAFSVGVMQETAEINRELRATRPGARPQRSNVGLPLAIGIGLGVLGVATGLGAVMPSRFFERFVKPPGSASQRIAAPRDYFKV